MKVTALGLGTGSPGFLNLSKLSRGWFPLCSSALLKIFFVQSANADCGSIPGSVGADDGVLQTLDAQYRPRGSRTTLPMGALVFDASDAKLKFCDGTSWQSLQSTLNTMIAPFSSDTQDVSWGDDSRIGKSSMTPTTGFSDTWPSTTKWLQVSSGINHTCAIRQSDSRIFCWGDNTHGQLGDGTSGNTRLRPTPLAAVGGWETTGWSALSTGSRYTCAIRSSDSLLFCWGENNMQQLGDGTTTPRSTPTALTSTGGWNATTWSSVSAGHDHTCAIRSSDSVAVCWGGNPSGQLGRGTQSSNEPPGLLNSAGGWDSTQWFKISTASGNTCGLRLSDRRAFCWGWNNVGKLGNGTTGASEHPSPEPLTASGGWDTVAWSDLRLYDKHTCAIRQSDSHMFCWGEGASGQRGTGGVGITGTPTPLISSGGWSTTAWDALANSGPSADHTCAIRSSDKRLFCFGLGVEGQLGDGLTSNQLVPTPLSSEQAWNEQGWSQVSLGQNHTCGLRSKDSLIFCWGRNVEGQLGRNSTSVGITPGSLSERGDGLTLGFSELMSFGRGGLCALGLDRKIYCWGGDRTHQPATPQHFLKGIHQTTNFNWVSDSQCARRESDNQHLCWGNNDFGQLGVGFSGGYGGNAGLTAMTTTGGWNVTEWYQMAGERSRCGVRASDRRLFCWGQNHLGQLGDGTTTNRFSPTPLSSAGGWDTMTWSQVETGDGTTCAIRQTDSRLFCWGNNGQGQLGDGTTVSRSVPGPLTSAGGWDTTAWSSVSVDGHVCAIRASDSRLFCWGRGGHGRLGNGDTLDRLVPTPLAIAGGFDNMSWELVSVAGTEDGAQWTGHTCAIRSTDHRLFCWGGNAAGQIGDGTTSHKSLPTALAGDFVNTEWRRVLTVKADATGASTCALRRSDDRLFCWGANWYGQVGNGLTSWAVTPTPVGESGPLFDSDFMQISLGYSHGCGILKADRTMRCWGSTPLNGTLGTGELRGPRGSPSPLSEIDSWHQTKWRQVSAGGHVTCAIREGDLRLYCWGTEWGTGFDTLPTPYNSSRPNRIEPIGGWDQMAWKQVEVSKFGLTQIASACAIRATDGRLFCWGEYASQLGGGAVSEAGLRSPRPLSSVGGYDKMSWDKVALTPRAACAIRSIDKRIFCWGDNFSGQLGDGTTTHRAAPAPLSSVGGWDTTGWADVTGSTFADIGSIGAHFCAIRASDRGLFCWGANWGGQLGDGTTTDRSAPTPLTSVGGWDVTRWKSVAGGATRTCAIRESDDRVFCWGENSAGALGDGTQTSRTEPTPLAGPNSTRAFESISLGTFSSVAIPKSTGRSSACSDPLWQMKVEPTNLTLQLKSAGTRLRNSRFFSNTINDGLLVFNDSQGEFSYCGGGEWRNLVSSVGGPCSSLPTGGSTDGFFNFFNLGKLGLFTRNSGLTPSRGTLIYNSTSNRLQFCDGVNWREIQVE